MSHDTLYLGDCKADATVAPGSTWVGPVAFSVADIILRGVFEWSIIGQECTGQICGCLHCLRTGASSEGTHVQGAGI